MSVIKEKLIRHIYKDGEHEFFVTVDFGKLDPALFVKAMRSAQSRATLGHGAIVVQHHGRVFAPRPPKPAKKAVAP